MAKSISMTMGIPGVELWVNYLDSNLRITTVEWTLPQTGIVARMRLWNAGVLFYDRTVAGPASGAETVPGNHRMVEVTEDPWGTHLVLPSYITYSFTIQTIG